jgi:hypothetical protein
MTFYADSVCRLGALSIPADGTCHPSDAPLGAGYNSYRYVGQASNVECQTSGSSTARDVRLTDEQTICCPR